MQTLELRGLNMVICLYNKKMVEEEEKQTLKSLDIKEF